MAEAAFDTLATARRLREGGFDEGRAEAIALAIREGVTGGVATKADVAELRGEVASVRGEIERVERGLKADFKSEIASVRGEVSELRGEVSVLRGEIERVERGLKADFKSEIASVRGEIDKAKFDLTWRLLGGIAVLNGLLFLALRGVS